MTNTELKKHESEITRNITKTIKWIVDNIKNNPNVEKEYRTYRNNEVFDIKWTLDEKFSLDIHISPEEYNHSGEKIDGGISMGFNLLGEDARHLSFTIKVNDKKEAYAIDTFYDYTKNYFEVNNPKLNKIISEAIVVLHKKYKEKKEASSIKNLNILKEFISQNIDE